MACANSIQTDSKKFREQIGPACFVTKESNFSPLPRQVVDRASSRSNVSVFSSPLVKKLHYRFYPIARSRGGHKFHCDHRSSQVIFLLFEASFLFRPNEIVRFVPFFAPKLSFIQTSASLTNFASFLFLFFFSIILRIN